MIPDVEQNLKEPPPILQRETLSGISNVTSISVIRQSGYAMLSICLCSIYLLLPIERGFPVIRILGYPFTLTMLVTIAIVITLAILFRGHILIPGRHTFFQALFVFTLFIAAAMSQNVQAGMFIVLSYFVTFILNYVILFHLFANGFRRQFTIILCVVTTIAAVLCILEGLFHFYLPFYATLFQNFNYEAMTYQLTRNDFRALGVLGNPIISSVGLSLAIPFVSDLKHPLKYVIIALILWASILTASRTILIFWACLAIGRILMSKRMMPLLYMILGLIVVFLLLPIQLRDSFVSPMDQYLNRGSLDSVYVRQGLLDSSLAHYASQGDVLRIVFGEGLKSTSALAQSVVGQNFGTLDNVYATVLIEAGLLGFGVFLLNNSQILIGHITVTKRNLHWYTILGLVLAGFSFVTIYYATFNLLWVASIAVLDCEAQNAQRKKFETDKL